MHRSQILLENWQYETLKARAEQQGQSISEVVREILAQHLTLDHERRLAKLRAVEGLGDAENINGRDHDIYLYPKERS